jgi:hypothetical protein
LLERDSSGKIVIGIDRPESSDAETERMIPRSNEEIELNEAEKWLLDIQPDSSSDIHS